MGGAKAPVGNKSSKMKFTCPECGQNAWAKPDALLLCGECFDEGEGEMCFMLSEQETSCGQAHAGPSRRSYSRLITP